MRTPQPLPVPKKGAIDPRFWAQFDGITKGIDISQVVNALASIQQPKRVLETGGKNGHVTQAIASALAANGTGKLTTLEPDTKLADKLRQLGLPQVEIRHDGSERFFTDERYDMAVFNGAYASLVFEDQEAEFFHAVNFLEDGASVVFVGYKPDMHRLSNLPRKLEEMGLLEGGYIATPRGAYVGTYRKKTAVKKRIVCSLSAGRSGTAFLTSLLRGAPGTVALHEPEPRYQWQTLELQKDPASAEKFVRGVKLPWIYAMPGEVYVEASHYINKGFLEAWINNRVYPDMIVLRRPARKIALSWYTLGVDFFNNKRPTLQHIMRPDDARPLLLPLHDWQGLDNYQLCYWYALECEKRTEHYLSLLKPHGVRVFETALDRLCLESHDDMERLFAWLGVELQPDDMPLLRERQKRKVNDKDAYKFPKRIVEKDALDFEALEAEVRKRCGLA